MSEPLITVEVTYALPDKQRLISLRVPVGTTVFDAARQSGIGDEFEGLDLERATLGIFGKVEPNPRQRALEEGDRVEIYRPLTADPKETRKARAKKSARKD
ncbi:MAG: RnfH family protein [Alcanivorax sp.]|nr:RnfH family protein [Alcanivorax sp.]